MAATEQVILVDKFDNEVGISEKIAAHEQGLCHRAFSIFIFREQNGLEILLQKRADGKYHCGGLWTNTCCSHPRPGEEILNAGKRRLNEEMGFSVELSNIGNFHYIAHFDNGLTENEFDHVLIGKYAGEPIKPNPSEVQNYRWVKVSDLQDEIKKNSADFTPWLSGALRVFVRYSASI